MNDLIRDSAFFIDGKTKYLLCTDQKGFPLLKPIFEKITSNNHSLELLFIGENAKKHSSIMDCKLWLSQQKMGSYLYIACEIEKLKTMKKLIDEIGFTEDEVQFVGYGLSKKNIFCCRCHNITETDERGPDIQIICKNCNLLLSVSDHYSKLRDAFLGYVAKL